VNNIICGDSAIMLLTLEPESVDLTVTSPPYDNLRTYNGYTFDFETIARELYRVTKPGGVVVWVVGDATIDGSETLTSFRQALFFRECGFNVETMIYQTVKPPMIGNRYQACFEYMFVFSKGTPATFNPIRRHSNKAGIKRTGTTYRRTDGALVPQARAGVHSETTVLESIWYYHAGGKNYGHPAPFPEGLARDHILSWSNPGDLVLDPFAGSGTTLKMAKETGRNYIGIEISTEYCKLIERRIAGANVPLPLFVSVKP
jgi:DNA modification methylase